MDPNKYFIGHDLRNTGWKEKFRYAKTMESGWDIFTGSSVAYVTVDFKKNVSDLSHHVSTLI